MQVRSQSIRYGISPVSSNQKMCRWIDLWNIESFDGVGSGVIVSRHLLNPMGNGSWFLRAIVVSSWTTYWHISVNRRLRVTTETTFPSIKSYFDMSMHCVVFGKTSFDAVSSHFGVLDPEHHRFQSAYCFRCCHTHLKRHPDWATLVLLVLVGFRR